MDFHGIVTKLQLGAADSTVPAAPVSQDSRGGIVLTVTAVFTALSIATTGLRCGIRLMRRQFGWDDLTILLSVLTAIISLALTILSVQSGYGQHLANLAPPQIEGVLKWLWGVQFLLFFTLPLTKISICFFIQRIKNVGWLKYSLWTMIAGLVLTNLAPVIVLLAECQPLYAYWDSKAGVCWSANIYDTTIWVGVAYGIVSDVICTCLPIVVLWKVQMRWRMKIMISALMGVGVLATACAGVRAYLSAINNGSKDPTYDLAMVTVWAELEQHLAILGTNFALSRYIWLALRRKKVDADSYSLSQPLSGRRRYDTFRGYGGASDVFETVSGPEHGGIRATTDIDVHSTTVLDDKRGPSPVAMAVPLDEESGGLEQPPAQKHEWES